MKIINRWPNVGMHLRNIDISLFIAKGNSYVDGYRSYNLGPNRIGQIYRILMANLCEQKFDITYLEAVNDKRWYKHPDAQTMIREYLDFYINDKKWRIPQNISGMLFYGV